MANLAAYLVDPLVDALNKRLVNFVPDELSLTTGFDTNLKDITEKFEKVQTLLADAEKKSLSNNSQQLRSWLKKIKDSAYDMEDFLEDIRNPNVEQAPIDISNHVMRAVFFVLSLCAPLVDKMCPDLSSSDPESLEFQRLMGHKMKDLNQSLYVILRTGRELGLTNISSSQESTSWKDVATLMRRKNAAISTIDDSLVFGRDDDKNNIIKLLLDSDESPETSTSNKDCSVIAIVGIGGIGKTTLAQLVFNDKKINKESKCFDVCLWVSVPVNFNLEAIFKTMFRNCELQGINNVDDDLEYMSSRLVGYLREKKVFIVMDDVWSEDRTKWEKFMSITKNCKKGSKILITTRSEKISRSVRANHVIQLKGLSEDDGWKLFHKKAFDSDDEMNEYPNLHSIGKNIVKRCVGVPLAINALGAMLCDWRSEKVWKEYLSDIDLWERVENSELDDDQKVMCSLKLTFSKMSPELKRCFIYCSPFSKGCLRKKT